jgi:hypothetical protein
MAMLAYDTFHGLEHIFDYLDVVDLVHSEVCLRSESLGTPRITRDDVATPSLLFGHCYACCVLMVCAAHL